MFRSWWQQIKRYRANILVVTIILVVVVALIIVEVRANGTGFAGKTLWDWLQLLAALAIPVVVGFGAVWFTTRQGKLSEQENRDNQRENALQAYINKMSDLILRFDLPLDEEKKRGVRKIAHIRTLTTLPRLDEGRKGMVIQFLSESELIDKISLDGADLRGATLRLADLKSAILSKADMGETDLRGVILEGANLEGANLSKADLTGASLSKANLTEANLSKVNLKDVTGITIEKLEKQAKSLKGATMPDGSLYE